MKIVYLPLCCVVLGAVGCSKKNDSQPQDSAAPYVRINAQFNGNQGQTFLNGYDASICTATVTTDPTSPTGLLFNFVAADPNGQQCEEVVSMERSKLKAGIVGTYTLGSDFYLTLKYHPAAGTTCNNSVASA